MGRNHQHPPAKLDFQTPSLEQTYFTSIYLKQVLVSCKLEETSLQFQNSLQNLVQGDLFYFQSARETSKNDHLCNICNFLFIDSHGHALRTSCFPCFLYCTKLGYNPIHPDHHLGRHSPPPDQVEQPKYPGILAKKPWWRLVLRI